MICSFLFIYSIIYQHGLIYFILLVPIQIFLFCCFHCSTFGLWELFVFWTLPTLLFSLLLVLPYFLALQDVPGSSCIFPMSALESSHLSKEPWFFLYWGLAGYTWCNWHVTAFRPSQWTELGNICWCTSPRMHTNLCISLSVCMCINMSSYWHLSR